MMVVRNYIVNDVEYMVINGIRDYMPGMEAVRLLAHYKKGVGADRVMVFTGSSQEPSFRLYTSNGEVRAADRDAYVVLAHYLRKEGILANAAELVRNLGDEALTVAGSPVSSFEVRLTDHFLGRLKACDKASSAVA